ncbi:zinc finger and BTB domain-containing protein 1 [Gastrophryne carolinensis]
MCSASHSSYMLQQLYKQREWGFLCDCCISIQDTYFQAHRAVLAACSSYFKMLFINQQHNVSQVNLSSSRISAECFDLILQFMYLGKIRKAPENFSQLTQAMRYLQLYIIPDGPDDIQESDSAPKCSSSASSSLSANMAFGVRMYEEEKAAAKAEEEPAPSVRPAAQTQSALPQHGRQQPRNLCKKTPSSKVSHARERGTRRFGRSYTCEGCGFVFSCEKLLDEHAQTCTNRHFFQGRQPPSGGESPASKPSPHPDTAPKADSSQAAADESSTSESARDPGDAPDALTSAGARPLVIKIESDENSLEMDDINVVKICDRDYLGSSDLDDFDDDADDGAYYIGIPFSRRINNLDVFADCRKEPRCSGSEHAPETSCELCGLVLDEQELSSHYLAKHIENICACGKCGQVLVKGRRLQEHAQRCGEAQEPFDDPDDAMPFEDAAEEESSAAGEAFADMWEELNEGGLPKRVYRHSSCPYRCPNCGQRFEAESQVAEHAAHCAERDGPAPEDGERDHRRKHFCDICGKGFYQRCHLREHYTVHTKEKQFSCQTCGKQFLRERQLRLHNDMHTGMARYVCALCDQGNFRKHDHVRHMISHLGAGETICQVCFQIFPGSEHLAQHMDVHLYTCGVCGAKFNLRKDMRAHYNSKHFKRA